MLGTPAKYILHTAYCIGLAVTAHCLVALLGLVRLWLGFGFGSACCVSLCLRLRFPPILLVCSFVSACISLYFCVCFSLFRLVFLFGFLLVSACVLRRSSLFPLVFLLVPACVSPGLCLCCSLFLRVFPSASASGCLCFCVCACFVC